MKALLTAVKVQEEMVALGPKEDPEGGRILQKL